MSVTEIDAMNPDPNPYLCAALSNGAWYSPRGLTWPESSREDLVRRYAWGIPDDRAVERIAALSPIVEVGAGTGYWARLIAAAGGEVEAIDASTAEGVGSWYPVITLDLSAYQFDGAASLFLCWPPCGEPMAFDALTAYSAAGGRRLAYVGEGYYGCTADDAFHGLLDECWNCVDEQAIPRWPGIHDRLYIYERREL